MPRFADLECTDSERLLLCSKCGTEIGHVLFSSGPYLGASVAVLLPGYTKKDGVYAQSRRSLSRQDYGRSQGGRRLRRNPRGVPSPEGLMLKEIPARVKCRSRRCGAINVVDTEHVGVVAYAMKGVEPEKTPDTVFDVRPSRLPKRLHR